MRYLIDDISKLTTVDKNALEKIAKLSISYICDSIDEDINIECKELTKIDISIGTLIIGVVDNVVKYKFIPSKELEENIISTIKQSKNPLKIAIEKALVKKIEKTYKELL